MTDSQMFLDATPPLRPRLQTAWPVLAGSVAVTVGTIIGQGFVGGESTDSGFLFPVIALAITGAAILALARVPAARITGTFVALSAASATLVGLLPYQLPAADLPLGLWLITAPWRYALPPLMVHFVLQVAWPQRAGRWYGPMLGLYVLHASLWAATLCGLLINESALIASIDVSLRTVGLEPLEWLVAVAAGASALAIGGGTSQRRRAIALATMAVTIGFGAALLHGFFPSLATPLIDGMTWDLLPMSLFPLLGLAAVLAIPRVDPVARELLGHQMAAELLAADDVSVALERIAGRLCNELEADNIRMHLVLPRTTVLAGPAPEALREADLPQGGEPLDQRRLLVAPLGSADDALGDVRLTAPPSGAFGKTERLWLEAILRPVGAAAHARHQEASAHLQMTQVIRRSSELSRSLTLALTQMPIPPREDGMGVPPPVDATEVLAQLKEGITTATTQSDTTAAHADAVRARARHASDQVANALDSLASLSAEVAHLSHAGEEIAASNETVSAIAFRTNLLANNASLEATRSGAAGRTFGVLAEEIRRLADSATSTSAAIGDRTNILSREVAEMELALQQIREALGTAIGESEGVEEATRLLNEEVSQLGGTARGLRPAIDEAFAVAARRTARDRHQSEMLVQFLDERQLHAMALEEHRVRMETLAAAMERVASGKN